MISKLLCVDDDRITLMLCKMMVERANFAARLDTALNGEEAIQLFEQWAGQGEAAPELIFLDLNMPIMNGWEFLDQFVERFAPRYPATRVIIISSSVDERDEEKAGEYSVVLEFIRKPISVDSLDRLKTLPALEAYFS